MAPTTGMIRTVVTEEDASRNNGLPGTPDDYKTRLLKYIPAEAVALYTGLVGIPESLKEQSPGWYWIGLILVVRRWPRCGTASLDQRLWHEVAIQEAADNPLGGCVHPMGSIDRDDSSRPLHFLRALDRPRHQYERRCLANR
jgi:hypothetical protein